MRWLLLAVLLGGCLGPSSQPDAARPDEPAPFTPDPPPADGSALVPMLLTFDYTGCDGVQVPVALELGAAQGALPEGYTASQSQGSAHVEYLWLACSGFATPATVRNDTVYGHVAVRIEAPGNASEADTHWYRLRMLSRPDILETVWVAAEYDVYAANLTSEASTMLPIPERVVALGDYEARLIGQVEPSDWSGSAAYYTETASGRLEWTGTVDAQRTAAAGSLEVPADDPFAGDLPRAVRVEHVRGDFTSNDLWLRL